MKKSDSTITLTQRQIWAIAILIMFIIIAVTCWRILPFFNDEPQQPNQPPVEWSDHQNGKAVEQPRTFDNKVDYPSAKTGSKSNSNEAIPQPKLFPFDPNTASVEDFVQLGLRPKVAQTIINYRNKGGKFYKKEDFSKIYTLSDEDYSRLSPYIRITSVEPRRHENNSRPNFAKENNYGSESKYPQKSNRPVPVNTGTLEQFMELKGIGNGYANRIIKYREILGGYHNVEQLKEVYGMTDSLYEAIKPFMIIDKEHLKQIAVNTATEEELYKHPYIRKMAKHIVAYRNDIGGFKQIEEFKQVPLINEEIYRKIVPYLSLNN